MNELVLALAILADGTPNPFRPFFEGNLFGIAVVLGGAAAMIAFWIWRDRRGKP
jgi:hypothetical protein